MALRSLFASPVFPEDETRTVRARLLNAVLLANIVLMAICAAAFLLHGGLPSYLFWVIVGFAGISAGLRRAVMRGWDRAAGVTVLALGFVATTAAVASLGTIRVPVTGFYFAIVIGAGLLFDLPGLISLIALASAAIGGLIIAENSGWLPPPNYAVSLTQWMVSTAIFATVGGWTYAALGAIRRGLETAERELAERRRTEALLRAQNEQLAKALADVKALRGMLPICCSCKKIRDDQNYWHQVENYIADHTDASFTHGFCPECAKKFMKTVR